jgi:hypothetical protein
MKASAGKYIVTLVMTLLTLLAAEASARITATVDRADVAMGETLRLVLSADAGERPDEVDLSGLERDFEILKRSSATSARLVNGEQSVTRTLELELAPRRVGLVTIPSLTAGGRATTPIAVKVSPAPQIDAGDALVLFGADADRDSVYVQAQLLLTLTLQQAISLDQREVTPLEIPNADVEMLEQRTFQRQINGRLWQVIELRYAIFPQQSGRLTVPSLSFSGREILPGRSLLGARLGRRIQIETDPITVEVKPVPQDFPGTVWLPARSLDIEELWSKNPEQLALGDSSTRTLTLRADGLQGSQLPPLDSLNGAPSLDGLRFYPGQENIQQLETEAGLTGIREQSEALVPSQPGNWTLPEQRLPWWNTETDSLEYARVPAREIRVLAPAAASNPTAVDISAALPAVSTGSAPAWVWGLAAAGWLLSALLAALLWQQRYPRGQTPAGATPDTDRRALVSLRLACQQNDAPAAREALLAWARRQYGNSATIADLQGLGDENLAAAIDALNRALYAGGGSNWDGQSLFSAVRDLPTKRPASNEDALSLYPTPAR